MITSQMRKRLTLVVWFVVWGGGAELPADLAEV